MCNSFINDPFSKLFLFPDSPLFKKLFMKGSDLFLYTSILYAMANYIQWSQKKNSKVK